MYCFYKIAGQFKAVEIQLGIQLVSSKLLAAWGLELDILLQ